MIEEMSMKNAKAMTRMNALARATARVHDEINGFISADRDLDGTPRILVSPRFFFEMFNEDEVSVTTGSGRYVDTFFYTAMSGGVQYISNDTKDWLKNKKAVV